MERKSKISNFWNCFVHKDVGYFYISVNDVDLREIQKPFENSLNNRQRLSLCKWSNLINPRFQVTLQTKLHDDIDVILIIEYFMAFDNIWMVNQPENLDFWINELLKLLGEHAFLDDLDCDL